MHLILTGATGLVGAAVLDAMIKNNHITKISIITRRPVQMAEDSKDPRINVILHQDFSTFPKEVTDQLVDANGCVWALGVSQRKVNVEDYVKITKDYTIAFAKAISARLLTEPDPQPFNFIFVSGAGTTFKPRFYTPFYGKIKGETELELAAIRKSNPLFRAHTVRPNAVDPFHPKHSAILPYIPADAPVNGRKFGALVWLISKFMKWAHTPTEKMGRLFVEMAFGWVDQTMVEEVKEKRAGIKMLEGGFMVLENSAMRRLFTDCACGSCRWVI